MVCSILFSSLVAHHCPLWSCCPFRLHFLCLCNMLTVCFLSRQAPSSLLEALEQHLASLEGKKVKDSTAASRYVNPLIAILCLNLPQLLSHFPGFSQPPFPSVFLLEDMKLYYISSSFICAASGVNLFPFCRASTLSNAVSSLASTGMSFTKVDEREKQAALEEEQARLKALKVVLLYVKRNSYAYFNTC